MRSVVVIVLGEGSQDLLEMSSAEDEDVVQAFAACRAHPALGEGVGVWSLDGRADHPGAFSVEDVIEPAGELRITVADQKSR